MNIILRKDNSSNIFIATHAIETYSKVLEQYKDLKDDLYSDLDIELEYDQRDEDKIYKIQSAIRRCIREYDSLHIEIEERLSIFKCIKDTLSNGNDITMSVDEYEKYIRWRDILKDINRKGIIVKGWY